MDFTSLREKYPTFIYHDYKISEDETTIKLTFDFEIVGLEHFAPTFTLKKRTDQMFGNYQQVDDAAFYLGMVELISYWKITMLWSSIRCKALCIAPSKPAMIMIS